MLKVFFETELLSDSLNLAYTIVAPSYHNGVLISYPMVMVFSNLAKDHSQETVFRIKAVVT